MLFPRRKWKDIEGYEGLYQVSNLGEVRSLKFKGSDIVRKLKLYKHKDGYLVVGLSKDSKHKQYLVHRLVAQAFISNPNNYPIINHKDENPSNSIWTNLEWCTYKYNNTYGTRLDKASKALKGKYTGADSYMYGKHHSEETKRKISKANSKKVQMIDKETEKILRVFNSARDANKYLGKDEDNDNISNCARGNSYTAWGYKWKYVEED